MPSQNHSGRQFDKLHSLTIVATAAISEARFVAYDGTHATSAGGVKNSQGVSEQAGAIGEAITLITSYSAPVEASEAIAFGAFVKPAADGSGRAAVGTATDHCGQALGAAAGAGAIFECQVVRHVRPAA
ncbi:DUF2190 domain-containing protein [Variovorax sp. LT1R20]|uniref:DUF2190 domain-containing protein n=1 Tax=Variovorax sp. LT1R20 TaxID=3443729 RepID=UPI003F4903EC